MKKVISIMIVMVLLLIFVAGCSGSGATTAESASASADATKAEASAAESASATVAAAGGEDEITIGYLAKNMSIQWIQNMEAATEELAKQQGFKFVVADAESSAEKQMTQMQSFISDGVDGMFILVADVGTASAMATTASDAGVPLIGDSLRLADDQGNLVAPAVELYSYECGHMAGEWIIQNYKSIGFNFGDFADVAFCTIDNTTQPNAGQRCEGAEAAWLEGFPNFPQEQIIRADVAADSSQGADAAFNQISSLVAANPQYKTWVVVPAVEDYGVGAARAVEAAGLDGSTIIVGIGGERAVEEWEGGLTKCWYASVYYEAKDCATLIIEGLMDVIKNGKDPKDLYPEFKEDGQDYAAAKFTGRIVTPDNYKEYISVK